jgi:hypothetical protein
MRKTLGKPGFLSGQDRNRTFEYFPSVFEDFERCFLSIPYAKNSAYGSIK